MRRVERDDAGDTVRIAHGRLPHDIAAPVVADDDRLVDPKMVEDSDDVAGQTVDGIGLDLRRTVARAVAPLVERDGAKTGLAQSLNLATPGEGDLRKAVAEHKRGRIVARPRIVEGQPDAVGLRELKGERLLVAEELARRSTFWKSGKPNRCCNAFFDASCRIGAMGFSPSRGRLN